MANEVQYGAGFGATLFDASRVAALFIATIGDKDYSLFAHPANMYFGDIQGAQTAVSSIPVVDLSDDEFASLTEIQEMSPSDITTAVANITVARRGLERDLSDMALSLDATGALNDQALADGLITAANLTVLTLISTVVATFTSIVGTSGATLTHATVRSAKQTLRTARVKGPYVCILSPKQFNEWETDFESLGGAVQMKTDQASQMAALTGMSYVGSWDNVDFFLTDKVTDDGTDFKGGMYGMGALGYKTMTARQNVAKETVMDAGFVVVEAERSGKKALSALIGNMWVGFAKIQDAGGVVIRSSI